MELSVFVHKDVGIALDDGDELSIETSKREDE